MVKICIYCGCSFKTNSKRSKYCSRECVNNSMRGTRKSNTHLWENKYKICENCNEKFFVHSAQENKHRFCSKKCSAQWRGKYNKNSYKASFIDCSSVIIANNYNLDYVVSLDKFFRKFDEINCLNLD